MQIIDSCYICTTPFQIINAVTLAYSSKKESDLYIVPQFSGASDYYQRIVKTGIFRKVVVVDSESIEKYKQYKNMFLFYGGIVWNYLRISSVVKSILIPDTEYKNIYTSSKANIGRLICLYYIRKSKKAEFFYFDDGEGSYDNVSLLSPKKADAFIRKMLFGKRSLNYCDTIYLYAPELFKKLNPQSSLKVRKLPSWKSDPKLLSSINYICDFTDEKVISQPVIFLDTLVNDIFEPDNAQKYRALRSKICKQFGKSLILKRHPRDAEETEYEVYQYKDIPFEVICANMNLNNSLFISLASSAVCMPKLLFDSEAAVILLYNLVTPKNSNDVKRDEFYDEIQKQYDDPGLFLIPRDDYELDEGLKKFSDMIVYDQDSQK